MTDESKGLIGTSVFPGTKSKTRAGSIGGVDAYVDDESRATVILASIPKGGESTRVHLHEGDTFELGPELWQVTEISSPNSERWVAMLTQVR